MVDLIVNVEPNREFLATSQNLLKKFGADNVQYLDKDANDLDYAKLDRHSVVINTSLTDMQGSAWFDNLPPSTLIAMQGRDHDPGFKFRNTADIVRKFPLSDILYSGTLKLQDPETAYSRFMVIGRK